MLAEDVSLTVRPDLVLNRIDEKTYGHFLEHIYHSCNGGLWGELIWDRSFEGGAAGVAWSRRDDRIVQAGAAANARLVFGEPNWPDYEFTLEARKTGGDEGFRILLRALNAKEFYWASLGGWGNVGHALERGIKGQNHWGAVTRRRDGQIEKDRWYRVRARCEVPRIQVWLDDDLVIDYTGDDGKGTTRGCAGVGTWHTQAQFRNFKVASIRAPATRLTIETPCNSRRPPSRRTAKQCGLPCPPFPAVSWRSIVTRLPTCMGQRGRLLIVVALLLASRAAPPPVLAETVTRVQESLPVGAVRDLQGFIGERLAGNREGYVKTFDIDGHTRGVEEKKHREWWWIGEQPGKWLESAALCSQQAGDKQLEEKARKILARLVDAQEPGGYLGITDPQIRSERKPLRGMDPYELYFMLHGLITAHEQFDDESALTAARKLGDYFATSIGPGKAEFWPSPYRPPHNVNTIICPQFTWVPEATPRAPKLHGQSEIAGHTAHYGWEGTLLIDPMLRLYQVTGEERYLDWSKWVVANIDKWSGWDAFSKLDQVADGTLGVHQLQPYVHAHTFHMNFLGFLRLYEATGDASLLRKVKGAWDDVDRRQRYITGGVSVGEHYEPGHRLPIAGHVVETCANMSWMELTQALLQLTGEVKYADAIERLMLNHVLAAQTIDGDCNRYHTALNGSKPGGYFHGPDCCTGSGHRLLSLLPGFIYAQGRDGLYVSQFVPSVAQFDLPGPSPVKLHVQTRYPQEQTITIRVEPESDAKFMLNVRIPGWCESPSLSVNGKATDVTSGSYARLDRTWKAGDTVTLELPTKAKWIQRHDRETKDNPWALVRGPVVYAIDTVWWNDDQGPMPHDVGREARCVRDSELCEVPAGPRAMGPFIETDVLLVTGETVRAKWVPFANVGRWYREGAQKPAKGSRAYSYAVWLQDSGGLDFAKLTEAIRRRSDLIRGSVDYVEIAVGKSESDHQVAGVSTTGHFNNRTYRHSVGGGWFSYEVKVLTQQPSDLVATYWGGETVRRIFDILVNDRKVATQILHEDKPGEFFEVHYPIPFDLVEGKTDALGKKVDHVTVKFQAHPGATAGGVFGLRVVDRRGTGGGSDHKQ